MNNISLTGNLGKDAELRFLKDGSPVLSFSVGDSQGRDKPTIWWNASLFGKRAESLRQYLLKGQTVTVFGNITERSWTDKDGVERKSMDVRVQDVALQGGKREAAPEPSRQRPAATPASRAGGFPDPCFDDEQIPF